MLSDKILISANRVHTPAWTAISGIVYPLDAKSSNEEVGHLPVQVHNEGNIGQHQYINAQIKLSASQQQWLIQVTGYNICLRFFFFIQLLPPAADLPTHITH